MSLEAFFTLHEGLPRQGPGSDASTQEALRRLPGLPRSPTVLDLGCGPGRQTLVLARALRSPVVAIDIHQPFLDQLQQSAARAGLADLVRIRRISMDALDYPAGSIDLIWSEGAIYIIGVTKALRLFRPLLRAGGLFVFTEATWLRDHPPQQVTDFWKAAYPDITTVSGNLQRAREENYEVLDTFALPAEDWWAEYYTPLQRRIAALRPEASRQPGLAAAIEEQEREIDLLARFGDTYGYVFYLLRKPGNTSEQRSFGHGQPIFA